MQLLIDTQELTLTEARVTISLLQSIIDQNEKSFEPEPLRTADVVNFGETVTVPDVASMTRAEAKAEIVNVGLAFPPPPPPPPPAVMLTSDENGDDIEVEIDDVGNIQALTVAVELPSVTPLPPGPAAPPEFDIKGMPYDSRIHASNRAKKIDGSWKNKRGVDANLVTACEAQNKPGNALTPNVSMTAAPVPPTVSAAVLPALTSPPAPPVPESPRPSPNLVGIVVPAAAGPSVTDFRSLMQKIGTAETAGKISTDQVNAILASVGLTSTQMSQLINNGPLIASVNAAVDAVLTA